MSKRMLIDATQSDETRVVVLDSGKIDEIDVEIASKKQIKSNIYLARVTRVEPSLQAAFVDYGGNRHGFLPFSEIHPDYYQIPVADREALIQEVAELQTSAALQRERTLANLDEEDDQSPNQPKTRTRSAKGKRVRKTKPLPLSEDETGEQPSLDHEAIEAVERKKNNHKRNTQSSLSEVTFIPIRPLADPASRGDVTVQDLPIDQVLEENLGQKPAVEEPDDSEQALSTKIEEQAPEGTETKGEDSMLAPESDTSKSLPMSIEAEPDAVLELEATADSESHVEERIAIETPDETDESSSDEDVTSDEEDKEDAPNLEAKADKAPLQAEDDLSDNDVPEDEAPEENDGDDDDSLEEQEQENRAIMRNLLSKRYKIQEVIKRRQILLVQVAKEERGNKGAALTTYLSLAGRYCVLMPNTARGGGISRKIASVKDRKRLKKIIDDLDMPTGISVIVRTAGSERTKSEIQRDYDYLVRMWDKIRETTLDSTAPALIHEEGDIIKRAVRDIYTSDMGEIVVDGEQGYKAAKAFMKMLSPSHARRVKQHASGLTPLFIHENIEQELESLHNHIVQLPSGGYIVLNQTEALVAIDVNSGRAIKERHIEDTALKTNLEAADEVARQLRLRDLAGLVVVDFIDMEENRNNSQVERRLRDALRMDRARIQTARISSFGLLELSRQRIRPSMMEATHINCSHCAGTGLMRSAGALALSILRAIEERLAGGDYSKIYLSVSGEIALALLNDRRRKLNEIEQRLGFPLVIQIEAALEREAFSLFYEDQRHGLVELPSPSKKSGTKSRHDDRPASKRDNKRNNEDRKSRRQHDERKSEDRQRDKKSSNEDASKQADNKPANEDKDKGKKPSKKRTSRRTKRDVQAEEVSEIEIQSLDPANQDKASQSEDADKPKKAEKSKSRRRRKAVDTDKAEVEASEGQAVEAATETAKGAEAEVASEAEVNQAIEPSVQETAKAPANTDIEPKVEKAERSKAEVSQSEDEQEPTKPKRSGWWSR